jgi:hypothetical protein
MAIPGKSVNLRVRPVNSVDLAFPVDGVISFQPALMLGHRVQGIDIEILYFNMQITLIAGEDPDRGRSKWDSESIFNYLLNPSPDNSGKPVVTLLRLLSHLRNTSEAADLDRALLMRQNAYLTSYSPEVLNEVRRVYYDDPSDESAVRYQLLKAVELDARRIHHGLEQAYQKEGWYNQIIINAFSKNSNSAAQDGPGGTISFEGSTDTQSRGYEFRYPSAENDLRYHQARAAVRQEFLNAWRMSEMCRNGDTTFANELAAIDQSIVKLQSTYIDTFLFAPFDGIITGVFHGKGDYVRAGEPVLRVEAPEFVYLVGTVKYRGMLRIGTKLEVSTTLFEADGATPVTVSGEVVAVRGHDSVSEQWDLLIYCQNFTDDLPDVLILPLNYNFDFESTTVTVTGP